VNESRNPYLPPEANVETPAGVRPINVAGKGRRFGTFVVDYVMLLVLGAILGLVEGYFFGQYADQILNGIPGILQSVCAWLVYYTFFEALWARTPGKWLFGTVVVTEDGGVPSLRTIIIRTLCRMIPFEPFSFFGERGWHDSISKTHVVLARAE
jgi:uncharacterized RDD family membrane protein YckC